MATGMSGGRTEASAARAHLGTAEAAGGRPGGVRPGPMRLPWSQGDRLTGPIGWAVMAGVVLLALVFYVATRTHAPRAPLYAPVPRWGSLTLSRVALDAARGEGEPSPRDGLWVSTQWMYAIPLLTGRPSADAEADYLVSLTGDFHRGSGTGPALPGSLRAGDHLLLLVRGFDGRITGLLLTNRSFDLWRLGTVHSLPLGFRL